MGTQSGRGKSDTMESDYVGPDLFWQANKEWNFSIGLHSVGSNIQPIRSRKRPRRNCGPESCSPTILGYGAHTTSSFPDLNKSISGGVVVTLSKSNCNKAVDEIINSDGGKVAGVA
ncbi:hypothetical protein E3N88_29840 [Mikania micrantha]|uniref:Uncharacterized protein n=1 Tax=Mikania micrantha TaxID=192012 RepID=A0A5N6MM36_9ASTR|nr:hypothetical protein E3N88_29840 [Mikania micrantha]